MNVFIKAVLKRLTLFFGNKIYRRVFFLFVLGIFAITEFLVSGLVRRTFVFYSISTGSATVEDRTLRRSPSPEADIRRYVDEVLLGPVSPDSAPLFPRETRLKSLLFRGGVVYADLTEDAALAVVEGGELFRNFRTLYGGIRRNFSFVKDVRLFVAGKEAYFQEFRDIFAAESKK
jgi:hypothetical protein